MRTQVAERMYRVTGQGIYADSQRLGKDDAAAATGAECGCGGAGLCPGGRVSWPVVLDLGGYEPTRGIRWGIFIRPAAWSRSTEREASRDLDPTLGVHLEYLVNDQGEVRQMLPMETAGAGVAVWPAERPRLQ
jgi:hypothetical protein